MNPTKELSNDLIAMAPKNQKDTHAPKIRFISLIPSAIATHFTTLKATFMADEASLFYCHLDNQDPIVCNSPYVVTGLEEGNHTLRIYAIDLMENQSVEISHTWTVLPKSSGLNNGQSKQVFLSRTKNASNEMEGWTPINLDTRWVVQ